MTPSDLEHWRYTFAGQAMQGLVHTAEDSGWGDIYNTVGKAAIAYADALIAKLQETESKIGVIE